MEYISGINGLGAMGTLKHILENNKRWAESKNSSDPDFFAGLAKQQTPACLWIGCSDSRVPPEQICGMGPGEIFVHRNIANLAVHTDLSFLSVLEYAVRVLQVNHIIVCGHYGCGGIKAAMDGRQHGLIDNWLNHIRDLYRIFNDRIDGLEDETSKTNLLCELNVSVQVENVCRTPVVQEAWKSSTTPAVHGLIYNLEDGILKDLGICVTGNKQLPLVPG
ncbi:MAG: carbonic anhydrase [Desulfosalsimonas sp.]